MWGRKRQAIGTLSGTTPGVQGDPTPAWRGDPMRRHEYRYWDGSRWTTTVADRGVTAQEMLTAVGQTHPPGDAELRAALAAWRAQGCPPVVYRVVLLIGGGISERATGERNTYRLWTGPKVIGQHPWRKRSDDQVLEALARPRRKKGEHVAAAESLRMLGLDVAAEQELADALGDEEGFQTFSYGTYGVLGLAGFDYGATFFAAYDLSRRHSARRVRQASQDAGDLVAIAWCHACGQVWVLDRDLRCARGHEQASAMLVVPHYLEAALNQLQRGTAVGGETGRGPT